jgi:hypothetical protein
VIVRRSGRRHIQAGLLAGPQHSEHLKRKDRARRIDRSKGVRAVSSHVAFCRRASFSRPSRCFAGCEISSLSGNRNPSRKMMRQIAGSFAEYEKARLVAKLKAARQRKRLTTGKCEGRKSHAEINPEMVHIAKGLRRRKRGNSQRAIAADLAARGYVNANGKQFSAASVASMLGA